MVDANWRAEFQKRMRDFSEVMEEDGVGISVKLRVKWGSFERYYHEKEFAEIDNALRKSPLGKHVVIVEHESGPEILIYIAAGSAVVTLTAAVVNLVTAIINARIKSIEADEKRRKEASDASPMVLIVRRIDQQAEYQEKESLEIPARTMPKIPKLTNELESTIEQIAADRVRLDGALKKAPKKASPKKKAAKKTPKKRKRG